MPTSNVIPMAQRLLQARMDFMAMNVTKTGINAQRGFEFYQLSDILPPAYKVFHQNKLCPIYHMDPETAYIDLMDTEGELECIRITLPFKPQTPILNREGRPVSSAIQDMGSSFTYYRRYLLMLALDIIELDNVDAEEVRQPSKKATRPASAEKRAEAAVEVANAEGTAPKLMINTLKRKLKELKAVDEATAVKTAKEIGSIETLTKKECEERIAEISRCLQNLKGEADGEH